MKVFVVLSRAGQYESRATWLAGVFASKELAESAIRERTEARLRWVDWRDRMNSEFQRMPEYNTPYSAMTLGQYDAAMTAAAKLAGPKPDVEDAEEFELIETEMGDWRGIEDIAA